MKWFIIIPVGVCVFIFVTVFCIPDGSRVPNLFGLPTPISNILWLIFAGILNILILFLFPTRKDKEDERQN